MVTALGSGFWRPLPSDRSNGWRSDRRLLTAISPPSHHHLTDGYSEPTAADRPLKHLRGGFRIFAGRRHGGGIFLVHTLSRAARSRETALYSYENRTGQTAAGFLPRAALWIRMATSCHRKAAVYWTRCHNTFGGGIKPSESRVMF